MLTLIHPILFHVNIRIMVVLMAVLMTALLNMWMDTSVNLAAVLDNQLDKNIMIIYYLTSLFY